MKIHFYCPLISLIEYSIKLDLMECLQLRKNNHQPIRSIFDIFPIELVFESQKKPKLYGTMDLTHLNCVNHLRDAEDASQV